MMIRFGRFYMVQGIVVVGVGELVNIFGYFSVDYIIDPKSPLIVMQLQPEVKQALKELPPQQRVVAYALKSIYSKIRNLHEKLDKQILESRQKFLDRFKQLEDNTSEIVNGKKLSKDDLASIDEFFVEEEKKELDSILSTPQPVKDYWLVAIRNSRIKSNLTDPDQQILTNLVNLSQKVTQTTFEISLTFKGNSLIDDGTYTRILNLQNGVPTSYKGDSLKCKRLLKQGLIFELSENVEADSQYLLLKFEIVTFIVSELVPYSLRYFLGEVDEDGEFEDDEDQEGEGDDDDEESEQQQPKPKNK